MRLSDRVRKVEGAMRPCFMEREYRRLNERYGGAAMERAYAFVYWGFLREAERRGLTVLDGDGEPPITVEDLRAKGEGAEWTEQDDRAEAALRKQGDYIHAHKVKQVPDWFLPLLPRAGPRENMSLLYSYLVETDPEARRLFLEELEAVEQMAAAHGGK